MVSSVPMRCVMKSCLQVPVHKVDLLQAAKALPDIPRAHVAYPLHSFQLCVGCGKNLVQPAPLADDRLDHELRESGDAPQDPVAARRHGMVEGVQLAVIAE